MSPSRFLPLCAVVLWSAAVSAQPRLLTPDAIVALGTVQADADGDGVPESVGQRVSVVGRVGAGTGLIRSDVRELYLQDGTGGMRVRLTAATASVLQGDSVLVQGTVSFNAGMAEMVDPRLQVVRTPPRLPTPVRLRDELKPGGGRAPNLEGHEGELVEIQGLVIRIEDAPRGRQLIVLAGTDVITAFAFANRPDPISFSGIRVGDTVRLRGIAAQDDAVAPYTGGYVLYPLAQSDVKRLTLSPLHYKVAAGVIAFLFILAALWAWTLRRQVRLQRTEIEASEARYVHLFNAAADVVVVLDGARGGAIIEANAAAQKALGVDAAGCRPDGTRVGLAALAADVDEATYHLATADRTGAASAILEIRSPDGETRPFEIETRRLQLDHGAFLVSVARDVADRRRYELGLLEAMQSAEAAREAAETAQKAAEEAARLKSAILANVSHELRTPLTAVIGFSEILQEEAPPDLVDYADAIKSGGDRLLHTLNDILDFSRLDSDRDALPTAAFDLVALARQSVAQVLELARRKGIQVRFGTMAPAVPVVHNQTAMERVLDHVVGNAVKFTDEGEVQVLVFVADQAVAIRVKDTGVGISEAFMPDLFEPFKQESDGHSRSFEGTGLGLPIAQRFVAQMGGEIRVWSQKGQGTLFEIALPVSAPGATAEPVLPSPRPPDRAAKPAVGPPKAATISVGLSHEVSLA